MEELTDFHAKKNSPTRISWIHTPGQANTPSTYLPKQNSSTHTSMLGELGHTSGHVLLRIFIEQKTFHLFLTIHCFVVVILVVILIIRQRANDFRRLRLQMGYLLWLKHTNIPRSMMMFLFANEKSLSIYSLVFPKLIICPPLN